ncbi:MFS transporter [bacterium 210820-DFI.6.37]|nr:MFS transporter [bacterium 210820-DFI.6.37]
MEKLGMKRINPVKLKIVILMIALQDVAAGATSPALASIIADFPQYMPSTVMMIASVPGLVQGIVAIFFGIIYKKCKARPLILFGFALFIVGGVAPFFLNSLPAIIFMRVLVGFGSGICMPMSMNLVADFYEGHEKDTMLGFSSAIGGASGVIFQSLGGFLTAAYGWHYCFLSYLIILIIALFVFFWLPEPEKKTEEDMVSENGTALSEEEKSRRKKAALPLIVILTLFCLLWNMIDYVMISNLSILLETTGMGDAASAGTCLSLFTVGAFIAGIVFGKIKKCLKTYFIVPFPFLVSFIGFLIVYNASGLSIVMVGTLICGFALGSCLPTFTGTITDLIDPSIVPWGIGFIMVANGLSQFCQAPIYDVINRFAGTTYGRDQFLISIILFAIVFVLAVIWAFAARALRHGKA